VITKRCWKCHAKRRAIEFWWLSSASCASYVEVVVQSMARSNFHDRCMYLPLIRISLRVQYWKCRTKYRAIKFWQLQLTSCVIMSGVPYKISRDRIPVINPRVINQWA